MDTNNPILEALKNKYVVIGCMISEMRTPAVSLVLDAAGLDFMIIDMEHGAFTYETVNDMLLACRGTRITPFVRIPEMRRECFQKPLDSGALGILVPRVETPEEVIKAVQYARYSPEGDRGLSLRRAHGNFRKINPHEFTNAANRRVMVMIQIESERGVNNIEHMLEIPGLDLVFIGPSDLSHSYGQGRDTEMRDGILKVITACAQKNISSGIHHTDTAYVAQLIQKGLRFISCDTEIGAIIKSFSTTIDMLRKISKV